MDTNKNEFEMVDNGTKSPVTPKSVTKTTLVELSEALTASLATYSK